MKRLAVSQIFGGIVARRALATENPQRSGTASLVPASVQVCLRRPRTSRRGPCRAEGSPQGTHGWRAFGVATRCSPRERRSPTRSASHIRCNGDCPFPCPTVFAPRSLSSNCEHALRDANPSVKPRGKVHTGRSTHPRHFELACTGKGGLGRGYAASTVRTIGKMLCQSH